MPACSLAATCPDTTASSRRVQRWRALTRSLFFALFLLAPPLDLLRLDLVAGHFIVFGHAWTLGIDGLATGALSPMEGALRLVLRVFLPAAAVVGLFGWASYRYGRVYCGWLCPHFSVVETINGLWRRGWSRPGFWERRALPHRRPDGRPLPGGAVWRLATLAAVLGFSALWAVTLLTWLLPPAEVWGNLLHLQPTRNQALFLVVATTLFAADFSFARHLFCRFGCAVAVAQSFVWMANRDAMVVSFDRDRARACRSCFNACEHACPMRLKPRAIKRLNFTCTQCARCIEACDEVQAGSPDPRGLLAWVRDEAARVESEPAGKRH